MSLWKPILCWVDVCKSESGASPSLTLGCKAVISESSRFTSHSFDAKTLWWPQSTLGHTNASTHIKCSLWVAGYKRPICPLIISHRFGDIPSQDEKETKWMKTLSSVLRIQFPVGIYYRQTLFWDIWRCASPELLDGRFQKSILILELWNWVTFLC